MRVLLAGLAVLALHFAPAAVAQEPISEEQARRDIPHYDAMKAAATRGRDLYRYDQAAWHATDRLLEEFDPRTESFMRGYIVLPRDDERLDAVFFGEIEGQLVEVARYTVAGSEVVGGGLLPERERPALSEVAVRMSNARQAAFEELRAREFGLCANSAPNTVVLPPAEDGTITVYVLTPPTQNGSYPMGGHYRVQVGADGKVRDSRRFMNTCFMAAYDDPELWPAQSQGRPEALVLTHLLDPQPTEIHVFASFYVPVMLMIATTENRQMWSIRQGSVGYVGPLEE